MGGRGGRWLLAGVLVLGAGCNRQDADRLSRLGRKGLDRVETTLAGLTCSLTGGQAGIPCGPGEGRLDLRVSARLRWDKNLAGEAIEVRAQGGLIELKGKVADLARRRRAVELAETTVGVEKVNDLLEAPPP
jgi:hypothetical protein